MITHWTRICSLHKADNSTLDTSLSHIFADVNMNFGQPTVVLENSAYIKSVSCSKYGLGVYFNNVDSFHYAEKQWTSLGRDFYLVSFSDGCERANAGHRTFWHVTGVSFDVTKGLAEAKCTEVGMENAAHNVDVSWGSYQPSSTAPELSSVTPAPSAGYDSELKERFCIWDWACDEIKKVEDKANVGGSTTFTIPWNAKATGLTGTPWGQQKKLFENGGLNAYCVDCETHGNVDIAGSLSINIPETKVKSGNLKISGSIEATLGLGLTVSQTHKISGLSKEINLWSQGIPALSIPEIITIGPDISVDFTAGVSLEGTAAIMVGGSVTMDGFSANLDIVHSDRSSASGFSPKFTPKSKANAEVTLSASIGLPVSIGFGINVPRVPAIGKREVDLVNTPSLTASANYSDYGPCANGIGLGVKFSDDTSVDVVDIYKKSLYKYTSPNFAQACIHDKNPAHTPKGTPSPSGHRPSSTHGTGGGSTPVKSPPAGHSTPTGGGPGSGGNGPASTSNSRQPAPTTHPHAHSSTKSSVVASTTTSKEPPHHTPLPRGLGVYNYPK